VRASCSLLRGSMTQSWPRHSAGSAFIAFKKAHQPRVFETPEEFPRGCTSPILLVGEKRQNQRAVCFSCVGPFLSLRKGEACVPCSSLSQATYSSLLSRALQWHCSFEDENFRTDVLISHCTRSEVEGVALPGPDLPYLVSDTQFHRPVQAVDLGADPQTAVLEGDLDQQPSEAHG
jgi:hypothetical protein